MKRLVIGSRGSELALAQARQVAKALEAVHPSLTLTLRVIRTAGDDHLEADLKSPGALGKGLFTKQLEQALLDGEVDIAIHSLKDLPVALPEGLVIGAIPPRADPRDVLVSKHPGGLNGLPHGSRIGTSSARREQQVLALRPDLIVVPLRGNVPTRVERLASSASELDAILLAKAGLDRLGLQLPEDLHFSIEEAILPAPGQGALAVQCRTEDCETLALVAALHDEPTARCVHAERQLLALMGGGCAAPIGALAVPAFGTYVLRSVVFGAAGMQSAEKS